MFKKGKINISALLLLLIYIFSNIPFALLHQHNDHIVTYENANSCEKSIYYGSQKNGCRHSSHLFKSIKHCKLCEKHIITPHLQEKHKDYSFIKTQFRSYIIVAFELPTLIFTTTSSRGPPMV